MFIPLVEGEIINFSVVGLSKPAPVLYVLGMGTVEIVSACAGLFLENSFLNFSWLFNYLDSCL
jgi:hypothetical protein